MNIDLTRNFDVQRSGVAARVSCNVFKNGSLEILSCFSSQFWIPVRIGSNSPVLETAAVSDSPRDMHCQAQPSIAQNM